MPIDKAVILAAGMGNRISTLGEALGRSGIKLNDAQRATLAHDGVLLGVAKLDRPIKHPNGTIESPKGWLPELPEGHPWRAKLSPSDDAYYSFVEERIFKAKLFDPSNAEHALAAKAYLAKRSSNSPEFVGWTYADRTECSKRVQDATGSRSPDTSPDTM